MSRRPPLFDPAGKWVNVELALVYKRLLSLTTMHGPRKGVGRAWPQAEHSCALSY
jgi:hypothetical protein